MQGWEAHILGHWGEEGGQSWIAAEVGKLEPEGRVSSPVSLPFPASHAPRWKACTVGFGRELFAWTCRVHPHAAACFLSNYCCLVSVAIIEAWRRWKWFRNVQEVNPTSSQTAGKLVLLLSLCWLQRHSLGEDRSKFLSLVLSRRVWHVSFWCCGSEVDGGWFLWGLKPTAGVVPGCLEYAHVFHLCVLKCLSQKPVCVVIGDVGYEQWNWYTTIYKIFLFCSTITGLFSVSNL